LAQVGAAISRVLDIDALYEVILDQATLILPFDYACLLPFEGEWARLAAARGEASSPRGAHVIDLRGPAGAELASTHGSAIRVSDTTHDAVWRDFPLWSGEYRIRSLMVAPLAVDDRLLGCFCVAGFSPDLYTKRHLDQLVAYAERAANALHNALLFAAERAQRTVAAPHVPLPDSGADLVSSYATTHDRSEQPSLPPLLSSALAEGPAQPGHVLENLRALSLLDLGDLRLSVQPLNLRMVAQEATAAAVEAGAADREVTLEGQDELRALGDPTYVSLILANLLSNAVEYTPPGSLLAVSWKEEDGMGVLRVVDHGPGIPVGRRRHLFTRFGWVPGHGAERATRGIGLGLYLSRSLAEAMDGALELE
jgi:two-component system sensor histidine kinase KdpD